MARYEPRYISPVSPDRRRGRWWRWLLVLIGLASIAGGIAAYSVARPYYLAAQQFDLGKIGEYQQTTLFLDRKGVECGRAFVENRTVLGHDDIPVAMRHAIVAVEDRRFFGHHGIDFRGLGRAIYNNVVHRQFVQGGSTLTQQLAKNVMGTFDKTLKRKLTEAFLAWRIENTFTKSDIIDHYLNRVYFGKGCYGIEAAAQGYFGKPARDLSLGECAMLAGIVRSPNSASPRNNMEKALVRRNVTLELMVQEGYLAQAQADQAKSQSITLAPARPAGSRSYFMNLAQRELAEVLNLAEDEAPQGLRVKTTLDADLQAAVEKNVTEHLARLEAEPSLLEIRSGNRQLGPLQAAAVVEDPTTGGILAFVGGRNFDESSFDRVNLSRRDNGSLFQPLLYALAMQRLSYTPASLIHASAIDALTNASPDELSVGSPEQLPGKRFATVQEALTTGSRACAVRMSYRLGADNVVDWLTNLGISRAFNRKKEPYLYASTLTLGELVSLYQALANQGELRKPYTIESVENAQGRVLYETKNVIKDNTRVALSASVCQQLTLTLQSIYQAETFRSSPEAAASPGKHGAVAALWSASEGWRDSWAVGFTPRLVTGVWVGFDQSERVGRALATTAAPNLWSDIMAAAHADRAVPDDFEFASEFTKVELSRRTGRIAGLGWLVPARGNLFAWFRTDQLVAAQNDPGGDRMLKVRQPDDWSDWLGTMRANAATASEDEDILEDNTEMMSVPRQMDFRMPGLRGDILSSDGRLLATTTNAPALVLPWPTLKDAADLDAVVKWVQPRLEAASRWLGREITFSDEELRQRYRYQRFHPLEVEPQLPPARAASFAESDLAKQGFVLQPIPRRSYPLVTSLAHTIGYLRRAQARNINTPYRPADLLYDDYDGAYGLEQAYNGDLAGTPGKFQINTTFDGFIQNAQVLEPARFGKNVRTTIDSKLQDLVTRALNNEADIRSGAVVVLDARNADVLAVASKPSFDPGDFVPALSPERWKELNSDPKTPLTHRALRQRNPPGSVFKVITSVAAIQAGVFDEERVVKCPGYVQIGNVTFSFPKERNSCSYNYALQQSINTYFMDLGLKTGRDNLLATASAIGVGQPTGIPFPGEHPGYLPSVESVLKTHGRNFGGGDVCNTSIGQGDLLCTPLQMANWMVTVATGGQVWKPRLVSAIEDRRGNLVNEFPSQQVRDLAIGRDMLAPVYKAMESVVKNGTAKGAQTPNVTVAGKTGTAQVGSKGRPRQIAWFGGFLPAEDPRYAFAVMVEGDFDQDLHGGSDAAVLIPKIFAPLFEKKKEEPAENAGKKPARRKNADANGTEFIENP